VKKQALCYVLCWCVCTLLWPGGKIKGGSAEGCAVEPTPVRLLKPVKRAGRRPVPDPIPRHINVREIWMWMPVDNISHSDAGKRDALEGPPCPNTEGDAVAASPLWGRRRVPVAPLAPRCCPSHPHPPAGQPTQAPPGLLPCPSNITRDGAIGTFCVAAVPRGQCAHALLFPRKCASRTRGTSSLLQSSEGICLIRSWTLM
jgi:hypothetical protein